MRSRGRITSCPFAPFVAKAFIPFMAKVKLNPVLEQVLTAEQLSVYQRTAQQRWSAQQREMAQRRRQAWRLARRAAAFLKQEYGATRVVVFGSLSHGGWFHARSDLDLAVEGLKPGVIWRAWSAVERVVPGFQVDLIELETATDPLRQRIEEQGKEL